MKSLLVFLLALFPFVLLGCGSEAAASRSNTLTLTGSSTVAPLVAELGLRFEKMNPGVRVDVQSGGSSRGISDVRTGNADLGMASRALAPSESDVHAHTIAWDGVGLIVHASNAIDGLDASSVRAIYTGELTNWEELGAQPGHITVVHKADGRATQAVFLKHFELEARDVSAEVIAAENEQTIKTVAGTRGAIGYVSIGTAEVDLRTGVAIKLLALDGIAATSAAVANGIYPMARPLNLIAGSAPSELALEFIDFAGLPSNADLVLGEAFVPVSAE